MKPLRWVPAVMLCLVVFLLFAGGFVGNSPARVARDHSLSLPPSASRIRCDGFFSITTFGDFGADASFEIASGDLPRVLSQFNWLHGESEETPPRRFRSFAPTTTAAPERSQTGRSRDGNVASLETCELGRSRTGVWVHTQWN